MSSGDELVTLCPAPPSSAGMRDALLLMISVAEGYGTQRFVFVSRLIYHSTGCRWCQGI